MKRIHMFTTLFLCLALCLGTVALYAQEEEKGQQAQQDQQDKKEEKKEKPKFKKYDEVITDKAVTKKGVFTTHLVEDKLYYEIPADQFEQEFLWVMQLSATQTSYSYGGMPLGDRVVRWQRRGDDVLLRNVEYQLRAEKDTPEEKAVEASSLEAIIKAFKIVTFNEETKDPVIDVTDLFTGDTPEFSPRSSLGAKAIAKDRTYINSVKSFPHNIETRVLATYILNTGGGPSGRPSMMLSDPSLASVTVEVHYSMVTLPEKLIRPRLMDARVGFFGVSFEDYSKDNDGVEEVRFISRWRLEKKDPDAAVSEPVQPIVFYVGRGVPERYREYVAQGIEMWQPAFEQAGFKNAIIAKEPPDPEVDPDWDAEDARYSVIRWLPSTIKNAFGPHISDPRTGEILEADVRLFHNVLSLARDWYFVKCAAADERAQKLPFSDELMGELIRYVACHEVGHSLGLRHNHKSSAYYTVAQLRDPEFTKQYGFQASIMDYSRFNYVAQPGDGAVLGFDKVGPYDLFAIEWGYTPFVGTADEYADKKELEKIVVRQLEDPRLRFGSYEEGQPGRSDPFARSHDQTGDPVGATTMGMANLKRIMGFIVEATTHQGDDYEDLRNMYGQAHGQMGNMMQNVAVLVGGIEYDKKVYGQDKHIFQPIAPERQRAAVDYLQKNVFNMPEWMLPEDIIVRIGMEGVTNAVQRSQASVLSQLLRDDRIQRMIDLEATQPAAYTVSDFIAQLTDGIFAELKQSKPAVNIYRRNLQRAYVEQLAGKVTKEGAAPSDMRAIARGTLVKLMNAVEKGAAAAADDITRYHLIDLRCTIEKALTGEVNLD